jgi:hypothetical protein
VAARLSEASRELPHDITERLKSARELALARAREARRLETANAVDAVGESGSTLVLGGGRGRRADWWLKLASIAPIVALVVGFVAIDRLHTKAQIKAAAEIDAALLADDVPPAAYSDPGFVEFLKAPRD